MASASAVAIAANATKTHINILATRKGDMLQFYHAFPKVARESLGESKPLPELAKVRASHVGGRILANSATGRLLVRWLDYLFGPPSRDKFARLVMAELRQLKTTGELKYNADQFVIERGS